MSISITKFHIYVPLRTRVIITLSLCAALILLVFIKSFTMNESAWDIDFSAVNAAPSAAHFLAPIGLAVICFRVPSAGLQQALSLAL